MNNCIRVGISSCLLGNEVRYDGRHSRNDAIIKSMSSLFELIPFCPEVAIGLSIPRPPINLVNVDGVIRVRGVDDPTHDVTEALTNYAGSLSGQLNMLSGYIFKSRSPSCGLADVNVYDSKTNQLVTTSAGKYATTIMLQHPQLPVVDERALFDENSCDTFIKRVLAYSEENNKNN